MAWPNRTAGKKGGGVGYASTGDHRFHQPLRSGEVLQAGHGAGIKPIVGADFNVQCDLLGDELTHLTVLAANNTGYQNLTLLISKAYQRGYGAAGPIIDRDWLIELNEGLILLPAGAWATSDAVFAW